jgi:hypothetical protein
LFIEGALGFGVYDFVSSLISTIKDIETKCLRIDCSEVISKSQVENQIMTDTGQPLSSLIYILNSNKDLAHFIIFDKIRGNTDVEALLHLLSLPEKSNLLYKNIFFIFISNVNIKQFSNIHIQLKELSLNDTELILYDVFGSSHFSSREITQIYERSEGVIDKLEQIMDFLKTSSVQEVLSQDDIFDDTFHTEHIPSITLKQIDLLINDPNKELTLVMLNILSILKNGETLSNLRKDKMGVKLNPRNTQELIRLELASTVYIDSSNVLIKINPIIKDYILSKISQSEIFKISNAYLNVTLIETQRGIKLSSINRKIYHKGYSTEEDNTNTLLKYSIQECKQSIIHNDSINESNEMNQRRLNKLMFLARSYVYILCNSSRFTETISSINNLIHVVKDIDSDLFYKYYEYIAHAHRMKSNHDEAEYYIKKCEESCPESDKSTLESIYTEKLYLLEKTNISKAKELAKKNKNNYHKNSAAFIISDVLLAHNKEKDERFKSLLKLEKKSRKLGHDTLANNILFTLNEERSNAYKINALDDVLRTDKSAYNVCRATIYKHQALVDSGQLKRIKETDIAKLTNIYNYLFRQKIDVLFDQCHSLLWSIAEHIERDDLIILIFFKGTIVWRLNSDVESEEKYSSLINNLIHSPLLGVSNE